jgi:hypothetical protein
VVVGGDRRLGAALARIPWPDGDALVLGAPGTGNEPGAAYVVRASTLAALHSFTLQADSRPAALALSGTMPGGGFGAALAVGDWNGDGALDLAIAAAQTVALYWGPLL